MTEVTSSTGIESRKRVLLVDDSSEVRHLMGLALQHHGYDVLELPSAAGLEASIQSFGPDVVLCDLLMPGRDGVTVCRSLKQQPLTRHIPVVLTSAKPFEGDKRAALEAGAAAYLVKPFSDQELMQALESALQTSLQLHIWGCRGSIASPERAIGLYGGNTTCISVTLPGGRHVIFDAGTGIRLLGNSLSPGSTLQAAVFLTHFHWDHIQGFPFFRPLYMAGNDISVHGPADSNEALVDTIEEQMGGAFFPISPAAFRATVHYTGLEEETLEIFGAEISSLYVVHPGRTLAYRLRYKDVVLVFAPDNEIVAGCVQDGIRGEARRLREFAADATMLLHDCQYSHRAYLQRQGWGHSCGRYLAPVAAAAAPRQILLFHHDPDAADAEVEAIHSEFRATLLECGTDVRSEPAREGATYSFDVAGA